MISPAESFKCYLIFCKNDFPDDVVDGGYVENLYDYLSAVTRLSSLLSC